MSTIERLPAIPLIANDPYFSIWLAGDTLTSTDTTHWSGAVKPLRGKIMVDGKPLRFLGDGPEEAMPTTALRVTPTKTIAGFEMAGVALKVTFLTPALPEDLDTLSTPVTFVEFDIASADGLKHQVEICFSASTALCYDGEDAPPLWVEGFELDGLQFVYAGQRRQKLLCHSADHITMDWGYLYLACAEAELEKDDGELRSRWSGQVAANAPQSYHVQIGYDDVASILYFGTPCKAWYARNGKTLPEAMLAFEKRYGALQQECSAQDSAVLEEAGRIGGADYQAVIAAAWRHTFAAHKLISTPQGDMAWISKENDSNGCMCTVDVSYPSTPLFMKYCPELINAMCRPVLHFASLPVWDEDFAPHDIGRYPIAGGQAYAAHIRRGKLKPGDVYPPFYLYPSGSGVYDINYQMPVEESGNMLIMLAAAAEATGDASLAAAYRPMLGKWVRFLEEHGENPGEQLCTDDFAGHLAQNVNLAAKAMVGIACYGKLLNRLGENGAPYLEKAREMAKNWHQRAQSDDGSTALTFAGDGWSQKYNLVWDLILGLELLPASFYEIETRSYLPRINKYGLPLDSRKTYTKSDWIAWTATMAQDEETLRALISPMAKYLRETPTRVPFSDWYDTVTGAYEHFIARSVQGGLFMPMLRKDILG